MGFNLAFKGLMRRLATGWTGWGSNPGGGWIFRTRRDRPCGAPILRDAGYPVVACAGVGLYLLVSDSNMADARQGEAGRHKRKITCKLTEVQHFCYVRQPCENGVREGTKKLCLFGTEMVCNCACVVCKRVITNMATMRSSEIVSDGM